MDETRRDKAIITLAQSMLAVTLAAFVCLSSYANAGKIEKSLALLPERTEAPAEESEVPGPYDSTETETVSEKPEKTGLKDGEYTGTGRGYGGPVSVKLTVKDGAIKSLDITGAAGETPAYLNMAKGVIPKIIAKGSADVDGVSGATLSSNGIKKAASEAIKKAGGKGDVRLRQAAAAKKTNKKTRKKAYRKPEGGWKDGTYTGSARGFGGPVNVSVTIKKGKISSISASGKSETSSYWNRALTVKNRILKKQDPKVDAVSGATYSSNGIINAVIAALSKAGKADRSGRKDQVITTSEEQYTVTAGDTVRTGAKAKTRLSFRSSNQAVAAVDSKGVIKALSGGEATITVTAARTKKYKRAVKKVKVSVTRKAQSITLIGYKAGSAIELEQDQIGNTLDISGSSTSGKPLAYSSDAPDVASVSVDGTVSINGTGKARITVSAPETGVYEAASVKLIIYVREAKDPDDPDDPPEEKKINGIFSGSGTGYGGAVTASVEIEDSRILAIDVEGKDETYKYWFKAKKIVPKMIKNQTWDIDAITGATLSSNGIREAVRQALISSGLLE